MSDQAPITPAQMEDIEALGQTFEALGKVFNDGDGTPTTLCMCSAACRRAADALDEIAEAWLRRRREAA